MTTAQVDRAGTIDADLATVAVARAYVIASREYALARQKMDEARQALDDAAGNVEAVTYAGKAVLRFSSTTRRDVDKDRLEERYPDVYKDVTTEATSYRLVIDKDVRTLLVERTWRAKLRSRKV